MAGLRKRLAVAALARMQAQSVEMPEADLPRSAVVFAPHPDDETLGCGGTILRLRALGATVHVVFVTDGSASHAHLMPAQQLAAQRHTEALAVMAALGVPEHAVHWMGYRDGELFSHSADVAPQVAALLAEVQPEAVFIPHRKDPPPDHRATHTILQAQLSAGTRVLEYPIWLWHGWPFTLPMRRRADVVQWAKTTAHARGGWGKIFNRRVDISAVLGQKRTALAEHHSQMDVLSEGWPTLASVSNGEWLSCFFQPYEYFWEGSKSV